MPMLPSPDISSSSDDAAFGRAALSIIDVRLRFRYAPAFCLFAITLMLIAAFCRLMPTMPIFARPIYFRAVAFSHFRCGAACRLMPGRCIFLLPPSAGYFLPPGDVDDIDVAASMLDACVLIRLRFSSMMPWFLFISLKMIFVHLP